MEKLVYEYLNSIVGDNPTLTVLKKRTHFIRGINEYAHKNEYYVNGILVGSRTVGIMKISMDLELYNGVRKLFGLDNTHTSRYFNQWLSNLPVDK
jgi:hypothetical protein